MGLKDDIRKQVAELLAPGDYVVYDVGPVPGPGDNRLTFGNSGVRFDAVVLYVDMRGSTEVLNAHHAHNVAKVHKAYLFVATKLLSEHGGQIRSYNGDSILAFFPGKTKADATRAIRCAMQMKFMLTAECGPEFARYREVDFGIGLDVGSVLCVKAGLGRNDNHSDLVWLGNAVNRATVLSDRGRATSHVWISPAVRELQEDDTRYAGNPRQDMWVQDSITYNGRAEAAWRTTYRWQVA